MVNLPEDIDPSIEQRIINAIDKDFNSKSPGWRLSREFKELLAHYIELTYGIAVTNTVDQVLQFIRTAKLLDPDMSVTLLEAYLKTTEFKYRKLKIKSYVQQKTNTTEGTRPGTTPKEPTT